MPTSSSDTRRRHDCPLLRVRSVAVFFRSYPRYAVTLSSPMNLSWPTFSLSKISIMASFSDEISNACSSFHTGFFPPAYRFSRHFVSCATGTSRGRRKVGLRAMALAVQRGYNTLLRLSVCDVSLGVPTRVPDPRELTICF